MRSLLLLFFFALTCSPHEPRDPPPSSEAVASTRFALTPTTADVTSKVHRSTLLVAMPRDAGDKWETRARDDENLTSEDLLALVIPAEEAWPETPLADALFVALCLDRADCEDQDVDLEWGWVAEEVVAAGLDEFPAGQRGDPWERYATLWLHYVHRASFFASEEAAQELEDGLHATLSILPDGPLRAPLVTAALLTGDTDEEEAMAFAWELVEEHDDPHAVIGLHLLRELDVGMSELDGLDVDLASELALWQARYRLEEAHNEGDASAIRTAADVLASHPQATSGDKRDARESVWTLDTPQPTTEWERALVSDARACAETRPGEEVEVSVRNGQWTVTGSGTTADCLFGWSWPDSVDDARRTLRVVR